MPKPSDALYLDRVQTPIGELLLVAGSDGTLRMLEFADKPERWRREFRRRFDNQDFENKRDPFGLSKAIARYFKGALAVLESIATQVDGTPFQCSVWRALRRIPAGATTSYAALAERIARPAAIRAVGLANGANPIAIVVPCHRVVGSQGSLTGYGGGLERKRWLLNHEASYRGQM